MAGFLKIHSINQESAMRRRFVRMSQRQQAVIYGLRVAAKCTFRKIEDLTGVPKSTIHYNIKTIKDNLDGAKLDQDEEIRKMVYFVLSCVLVGKASVRGIAAITSTLFISGISHVTALKILDYAAEVAEKLNNNLDFSRLNVSIFDEIFKKKNPILAMADPITGLIYLKSTPDRSSEEWRNFLEELKEKGLNPENVNCDGAQALLSALKKVFPDAVRIRDLFHVLYKLNKALRVMENKCYNLIIKVDSAMDEIKKSELNKKCELAIKIFSEMESLLPKFKSAAFLENEGGCGYHVSSEDYAEVLNQCLDSLKIFVNEVSDHRAIKDAKNYLNNGIDDILAYKRFIEKKLKDQFGSTYSKGFLDLFMQLAEVMDRYQRSYESIERQTFWGKKAYDMIKASKNIIGDDATLKGLEYAWKIFKSTIKSNSYIESINSIIRPHLNIHNKIPRWLCPLLTFYWNNRIFERGKRQGTSPIANFRKFPEAHHNT